MKCLIEGLGCGAFVTFALLGIQCAPEPTQPELTPEQIEQIAEACRIPDGWFGADFCHDSLRTNCEQAPDSVGCGGGQQVLIIDP